MLASCWVAANELAAREARESVSGWYVSEAVVMGWPDVLMSARKLEPETSLSFVQEVVAAVELPIVDH